MLETLAAAQNIIPTTTGAAVSTTETIPELKGLFDGISLRVPVVTGSVSDFTFLTKRKVTAQEVNEAFKEAAKSPRWKNILGVTEDPIVSSDVIGTRYSTIVDLPFTKVIDGDLVKDIPSNNPFSSGIVSVVDTAAPVVVGIMFWAAALARRRSLCELSTRR